MLLSALATLVEDPEHEKAGSLSPEDSRLP